MQNVTKNDVEFLDSFLSDDLSEEGLTELDIRLLDPDFKAYYEHRLEEKYDKPNAKIFADYLPLIILGTLVIIGIYLFYNSK